MSSERVKVTIKIETSEQTVTTVYDQVENLSKKELFLEREVFNGAIVGGDEPVLDAHVYSFRPIKDEESGRYALMYKDLPPLMEPQTASTGQNLMFCESCVAYKIPEPRQAVTIQDGNARCDWHVKVKI